MSIPSTLISGFIGLASCGSLGSRILHSLWLIEVDPHRGRVHFITTAVRSAGGIHTVSIDGYRKISPRTYCPLTDLPPTLRAAQGRRMPVISRSMGHMRPPTCRGMGIGL